MTQMILLENRTFQVCRYTCTCNFLPYFVYIYRNF